MRTTYDADVADMMGEVCSGGLYNCTIVHREGWVGASSGIGWEGEGDRARDGSVRTLFTFDQNRQDATDICGKICMLFKETLNGGDRCGCNSKPLMSKKLYQCITCSWSACPGTRYDQYITKHFECGQALPRALAQCPLAVWNWISSGQQEGQADVCAYHGTSTLYTLKRLVTFETIDQSDEKT